MPYSAEFKATTLKLADEIGPQRAAKQQGVSYNTIRRWRDPDFRAKDAARSRALKTVPCRQCGQPATRYERKIKAHEGLCRSCINTLIANESRGTTVAEIVRMYQDEKLSTNEIALRVYRSQASVHSLLANAGIEMRSSGESISLGRARVKERGPIDPKKLIRLHEKGMSIRAIARHLGCSPGNVQYWLRKLGDPQASPTGDVS